MKESLLAYILNKISYNWSKKLQKYFISQPFKNKNCDIYTYKYSTV